MSDRAQKLQELAQQVKLFQSLKFLLSSKPMCFSKHDLASVFP